MILVIIQAIMQGIAQIPVLGWLAAAVAGMYISMGIVQFMLAAHDSLEETEVKQLWAPHPFWKFAVATALVGLISGTPMMVVMGVWGAGSIIPAEIAGMQVVFGTFDYIMLALLIPAALWAIYTGIRFMFVRYLVMDRKEIKTMDALKESWRMSQGVWWRLFLLGVSVAAVNVVGFIALIIGILVTIPLGLLMMVHVYRELMHDVHEIAEPEDVSTDAVIEAHDIPGVQL